MCSSMLEAAGVEACLLLLGGRVRIARVDRRPCGEAGAEVKAGRSCRQPLPVTPLLMLARRAPMSWRKEIGMAANAVAQWLARP